MPLADSVEADESTAHFEALDQVDKDIEAVQSERGDALSQSLNKFSHLSSNDRGRVQSQIDDGLFQVAEDFIERIAREEELPATETETDRPFDRFFPAFVDKYSFITSEGAGGIKLIRKLIEAGESADIIDASGLSESARRDGLGVLDAWVALRNKKSLTVRSWRELMKAIGFDNARVKGSNKKSHGSETIFSLQATPVADRHIVRLPDFGSGANGKYRLVAIRRHITAEAIIREASKREAAGKQATILIFLGVLDADERRTLARDFARGDCHPTVVLDETLAAFLAAQPKNRLGAFFDSASAFAFSQPFDPDAAEVPPEMFFGRADARRRMLAMSGEPAHFLYGGRRLGKTALLSSIARAYRTAHQDEPKEVVSLINLKPSGIGENRPTEDLWQLFAEHLAQHGILTPQTVRPASIQKSVQSWLEEHQGRRILLLVDEADAFLDAERKPKQGYRVLEQVKRLMERTSRSFKVVFVGLHNVQRAARDPNTPFAHLGDPVEIGPMLPETDRDEIQKLMRNLFSWTIQLDPRYEFLTYLIAQRSFDNEEARPQAVSIADIRDSALREWREGFESDSSFWMFEVLLDEMVGLGILRGTSDKSYAIRTRNLRMLLGNDDDIKRRFVDAKSKRPPAIFDPAQFRATLSDKTPSSLTYDQQSRLLSGRRVVGLVFGTRLAGLDRIVDSLNQAAKDQNGSVVVEKVAPASLHRELERLSRSRKHGTHVVLVDMRGAWNAKIVQKTLTFVGDHDSQTRLIRPVFLCGPAEAWKWLDKFDKAIPAHKGVEHRDIWLGPCALEFTRNWLADQDSPAYSGLDTTDQVVDQPWPIVVGMAAQDKRLKSIGDAADAVLSGDHEHQNVSDVLNSARTKTALRILSTLPDDPITADDLSDLSIADDSPMSAEEAVQILDWADRLGTVHRDRVGYRLDSTYALGLGRVFQE